LKAVPVRGPGEHVFEDRLVPALRIQERGLDTGGAA
jgi:hypothetical protein